MVNLVFNVLSAEKKNCYTEVELKKRSLNTRKNEGKTLLNDFFYLLSDLIKQQRVCE